MEYESATQKVLSQIESILQNSKRLHHEQFCFVASGLKKNYRPRKPRQ
jgi:hypothetical protein